MVCTEHQPAKDDFYQSHILHMKILSRTIYITPAGYSWWFGGLTAKNLDLKQHSKAGF